MIEHVYAPASALVTGSMVWVRKSIVVFVARIVELLDQVIEVMFALGCAKEHLSSNLCPTNVPAGGMVLMPSLPTCM